MATLDIKNSGVGCPQSAIESAANISLTVRLIMQGKVSSIFYQEDICRGSGIDFETQNYIYVRAKIYVDALSLQSNHLQIS